MQVLSRPESLPPAAAPAGGREGGGAHDTHVGFWRNPKRFNVAVTRAKALLVVVGHPVVLMEACAALKPIAVYGDSFWLFQWPRLSGHVHGACLQIRTGLAAPGVLEQTRV